MRKFPLRAFGRLVQIELEKFVEEQEDHAKKNGFPLDVDEAEWWRRFRFYLQHNKKIE